MQFFFAIISGVLIFVIGQIIEKFILDPIQQYKKVVGAVDNRLKFYSNILTSSGFGDELIVEITDSIRILSCELEASYKPIPLKLFLSKIKAVETNKDVAAAAKGLIFLSNAGGRRDSGVEKCENRIEQIRKLLKIELLD